MDIAVRGLAEVIGMLGALEAETKAIGAKKITIGTPLKYAKYVHDGTAPHMIYPREKQALAWPGGAHPVRSVHHPGYRGNPFLTDALTGIAPTIITTLARGFTAFVPGAVMIAWNTAGLLLLADAKRRANYRTGELRNSLHMEAL